LASYPDIAKAVLLHVRAPLSAREILLHAYAMNIVPLRLYGKTQYKTLHASLSRDILLKDAKSDFFRTSPGRFFLRDFLHDPNIPSAFKSACRGRQRRRCIGSYNVVTLRRKDLQFIDGLSRNLMEFRTIMNAATYRSASNMFYMPSNSIKRLVTFVVVRRGHNVLTFRKGSCIATACNMDEKRSIGFVAPVTENDVDLFGNGDLGIINRSVRALILDCGLSPRDVASQALGGTMCLRGVINVDYDRAAQYIAALVLYCCPENAAPQQNTLAIRDLKWMSLPVRPDAIDNFNAWSQLVLKEDCRDSAFRSRPSRWWKLQVGLRWPSVMRLAVESALGSCR
jgi:HB1, ASXL, restriction endonuclease HTH domain